LRISSWDLRFYVSRFQNRRFEFCPSQLPLVTRYYYSLAFMQQLPHRVTDNRYSASVIIAAPSWASAAEIRLSTSCLPSSSLASCWHAQHGSPADIRYQMYHQAICLIRHFHGQLKQYLTTTTFVSFPEIIPGEARFPKCRPKNLLAAGVSSLLVSWLVFNGTFGTNRPCRGIYIT